MAYRRKYKDGGRVAAADRPASVSDVQIELLDDPPTSALLEPEPDEDAVTNSVRATIRAEELARQAIQAQQPQSTDQYIDRLPGLSDRRKAFLKKNTYLLDPKRMPAIERYYKESQALGNAADSDEEDRHIAANVLREIEAEHKLHAHVANAIRSEPRPEPEPEPAPAPAPRRSMPVTAPVTREVPTGARRENFNTIVLTPEQRVIARTSMSWLPAEEAERQYAFNLRRMLQGKANGEIQ